LLFRFARGNPVAKTASVDDGHISVPKLNPWANCIHRMNNGKLADAVSLRDPS
jgi:hypothetical protein